MSREKRDIRSTNSVAAAYKMGFYTAEKVLNAAGIEPVKVVRTGTRTVRYWAFAQCVAPLDEWARTNARRVNRARREELEAQEQAGRAARETLLAREQAPAPVPVEPPSVNLFAPDKRPPQGWLTERVSALENQVANLQALVSTLVRELGGLDTPVAGDPPASPVLSPTLAAQASSGGFDDAG